MDSPFSAGFDEILTASFERPLPKITFVVGRWLESTADQAIVRPVRLVIPWVLSPRANQCVSSGEAGTPTHHDER